MELMSYIEVVLVCENEITQERLPQRTTKFKKREHSVLFLSNQTADGVKTAVRV